MSFQCRELHASLSRVRSKKFGRRDEKCAQKIRETAARQPCNERAQKSYQLFFVTLKEFQVGKILKGLIL